MRDQLNETAAPLLVKERSILVPGRVRLLLLGFFTILAGALVPLPTGAASDTFVWYPYLQQLTASGVVILWATEEGDQPVVTYAARGGAEGRAMGESRYIEALDLQLHRVELTGLVADTRYTYRLFLEDEEVSPGERFSFRTAPATGSDTPFTFLAFGDYGSDDDIQRRLRDQMTHESFDFIVTTGDNAYPAGRYEEFDHHLFQVYDKLLSRAGFFPALGNHDYLTDNADPYLDLFDLPSNGAPSEQQERYYAFHWANAHFIVLDSNRLAEGDEIVEPMVDWLREELEANGEAQWKVAVLHHSPYTTTRRYREEEAAILRDTFVPIFEEYGVDLVLSGHDHNYQRTVPLLSGEPTPVSEGGIVYVVTGAGSGANYGCDTADWLEVAFCGQRYGLYTRATFHGDRLSVAAVDAGGAIRDCFTLDRTAAMVSATPAPGAESVVIRRGFAADADARIEETDPTQNLGRSALLRVDAGQGEQERSYLRFRVEGVRGLIQSATLWLYAVDATPHQVPVYLTDSSWDEQEVSWENRPDRYPGRIARRDSISPRSWVSFDVTSAVAGDGLYSFLLTGSSSDGVSFFSREALLPPYLVVAYNPTFPSSRSCGRV